MPLKLPEKFSVSQKEGIALAIQTLLIGSGAASSFLRLLDEFAAGHGVVISFVNAGVDMLAYIAIILYCTAGYNRGKQYYYIAVYCFTFMLIVKVFVKSLPSPALVGCALSFGLTLIYIFRLSDQQHSKSIICLVCGLLSITAIYLTIKVVKADATSLRMLYAVWTPAIMSGTLALTHHIKWTKEEYM